MVSQTPTRTIRESNELQNSYIKEDPTLSHPHYPLGDRFFSQDKRNVCIICSPADIIQKCSAHKNKTKLVGTFLDATVHEGFRPIHACSAHIRPDCFAKYL